MKVLLNILNVAFLSIGVIVGAGFVSGRELVSFFGTQNAMIFLCVSGVLIFISFSVVYYLASKYKSLALINAKLFNRGGKLFYYATLVSSFILLSGMLSGLDELWKELGVLPTLPVLSITVLVVVALTIGGGVGFLEKINLILVPLILVAVNVVVFTFGDFSLSFSGVTAKTGVIGLIKSILYVTMNVFTSLPILVATAKSKPFKRNLLGAIIVGIVLTVQAILIIGVVTCGGEKTVGSPLPLLAVCANSTVKIIFSVALFFGITTSVYSSFYPLYGFAKNRGGNFGVVILCLSSFVFSRLGLNRIVDYAYPLIGAFGAVYILKSLHFIFRKKSV